MTAKPAVEPANGPQIPVTANQVQACKTFVAGKLRNLIQECVYSYQPGQIAQAFADMAALQRIVPSDAGTAGIVTGPPASPPDAIARQQAAQKGHEQLERKRLGGSK